MIPRKITKILCRVLRHKPEEIGLMPRRDFVFNTDEVINGLQRYYSIFLTRGQLSLIVGGDPKRRIRMEGGLIFATYGHSSVASLGLHIRSYFADRNSSGHFWLPMRLSKWNNFKKHRIIFFSNKRRYYRMYQQPDVASSKAACWHKSDTPLILRIHAEGYMFNHVLHAEQIYFDDVKEVRQVVPAIGKSWEESRFTNNWSYSIIDADR